MQRFIDTGYAEKLKNTELGAKTCYIPHFGVSNSGRIDKVRLVFDAALKTGGVSLNDKLLQGPDLLKPLLGILMRFRQYKIGLKGDIMDMYLRVKLHPPDRDAQRFLWRGRERETVLQMNIK